MHLLLDETTKITAYESLSDLNGGGIETTKYIKLTDTYDNDKEYYVGLTSDVDHVQKTALKLTIDSVEYYICRHSKQITNTSTSQQIPVNADNALVTYEIRGGGNSKGGMGGGGGGASTGITEVFVFFTGNAVGGSGANGEGPLYYGTTVTDTVIGEAGKYYSVSAGSSGYNAGATEAGGAGDTGQKLMSSGTYAHTGGNGASAVASVAGGSSYFKSSTDGSTWITEVTGAGHAKNPALRTGISSGVRTNGSGCTALVYGGYGGYGYGGEGKKGIYTYVYRDNGVTRTGNGGTGSGGYGGYGVVGLGDCYAASGNSRTYSSSTGYASVANLSITYWI